MKELSLVGGEMSGKTDGADLLSVSLKCYIHLALCYIVVFNGATGSDVFFPVNYSLFMSLCHANDTYDLLDEIELVPFSMLRHK